MCGASAFSDIARKVAASIAKIRYKREGPQSGAIDGLRG